MKVLKILSSEFLPPYNERDYNTIYFLYDKLDIYFYQTQYTGLYSIVEELPTLDEHDKPVKNMLYILMNGDVYVYDTVWRKLAEIEDPSETEYLLKAGTTFLLKSGYRYIDKQTKALALPFQNGTFQLSVILDKPIEINNATIIVYNEETGKFEIDGERYYDEFGRNPEIMKYTGVETNSAKTIIQNDHISTDVKLSSRVGNTLEVKLDGLYVAERDYASIAQFEDVVLRTQSAMSAFQHFMGQMEEAMASVDITLNDQTLRDKILEVLDQYQPMLDEVINNFDEVIEDFNHQKAELTEHIYTTLDQYERDVNTRFENVIKPWGYFIDGFDTTVVKVDTDTYQLICDIDVLPNYNLYYKIGKEYISQDQDISELGFTQFTNGDELSIPDNSDITIMYGLTDGDEIIAKKGSYCKAVPST